MTRDIEVIRRRALALIELASEWGIIVTIENKSDKPLAMGNTYMHLDVREARELDPVTIAMIDDHYRELAKLDDDEDEWTCSSCGGPMYRQPQWNYGQCDDCGRREKLEPMEP